MLSEKSSTPLAVEYRAIDSIVPFARNARKHSRKQIRKLQQSLRKFGWTNPLLIDDAGNLICGHGRLPHTTRAALTGLKKKGHRIERTKVDGVSCYSLVDTAVQ